MTDIAPDDPRVRLAEDRTVLAAERTYAAWLRTGLAFLGGGLAVPHFLDGTAPNWVLRVVALAFLACALGCFGTAAWRDHIVRRHLARTRVGPMPRAAALGMILVLAAVSGLALLTLGRH